MKNCARRLLISSELDPARVRGHDSCASPCRSATLHMHSAETNIASGSFSISKPSVPWCMAKNFINPAQTEAHPLLQIDRNSCTSSRGRSPTATQAGRELIDKNIPQWEEFGQKSLEYGVCSPQGHRNVVHSLKRPVIAGPVH